MAEAGGEGGKSTFVLDGELGLFGVGPDDGAVGVFCVAGAVFEGDDYDVVRADDDVALGLGVDERHVGTGIQLLLAAVPGALGPPVPLVVGADPEPVSLVDGDVPVRVEDHDRPVLHVLDDRAWG